MQRDQVPQDPDRNDQIHASHLTLTQGTAQKHLCYSDCYFSHSIVFGDSTYTLVKFRTVTYAYDVTGDYRNREEEAGQSDSTEKKKPGDTGNGLRCMGWREW